MPPGRSQWDRPDALPLWRWTKRVACGCLLLLVVAGVAGYWLYRQDAGLRQSGREMVESWTFDDGDARQIALGLADHHHNRARSGAGDTKAYFDVSQAEYLAALEPLIRGALKRLDDDALPPQAEHLVGTWWRVSDPLRYLYRIEEDRTWYGGALVASDTSETFEPELRAAGTWALEAATLVWISDGQRDPNRIVRLTARDLIIEEGDGSLSHFRRCDRADVALFERQFHRP